MLLYVGILAMQVACIVHAVKTGRSQMWLMALFFFPVASALAYFIVEVLPGMQGNRHVRAVRAQAIARLDPEREVRAAGDALDLADTAANRIRLADAFAGVGRWDEAVPLYREALIRGGEDARVDARLARALFETGGAEEALAILDRTTLPAVQGDRDRVLLLRARVLEHLGRKDEALAAYADVVTRLPGEEARCRYAALLLDQGWERKARIVLEEVESRMKRLDRTQRAAEADMYRWAIETLGTLRAGG